ncbi:winged helix DNA-binding domain-containing protein [Kribbella sp. NPDC023855]|uniref:winged helix DNA-binding domain-containing protein n=1 Tax=Kribbella sp. NPDC023855 TaxID=3154698 RepID=UPI0033ECCE1F
MTRLLSRRTLNRTLLARQFLTDRTSRPVVEVIERLVAMQAQEPNWPYIGLWTRVTGFRHDDLTSLLHDRSVVRSTSLRRTQHLASSKDFRWLRPTIQPSLDSALRSPYFTEKTSGLDLDELVAAGREFLADGTLTRRELGRLFVERYPDRHGGRLASAVELKDPMVHPPPDSAWGRWGTPASVTVAFADSWIGQPLATERQLELMIRRYLAAFGPASVRDMQAWSGLTRLREIVDGLRPTLQVFRTDQGTELFDLRDTSPADDDIPAPVRFLPAFDNVVLGHADRSRIVSDEDRKRVCPGQAWVEPTFLVDGFVRGSWSLKNSTLTIVPFRALSRGEASAVLAEAELLLPFITDNMPEATITFG